MESQSTQSHDQFLDIFIVLLARNSLLSAQFLQIQATRYLLCRQISFLWTYQYMASYNMVICDWLLSLACFLESSVLSIYRTLFFFLLPLHRMMYHVLFAHQQMDIWIVSTLWLLQVMLLWMFIQVLWAFIFVSWEQVQEWTDWVTW